MNHAIHLHVPCALAESFSQTTGHPIILMFNIYYRTNKRTYICYKIISHTLLHVSVPLHHLKGAYTGYLKKNDPI